MRTFRSYMVEALKDKEEADEFLKVVLEEYEKDHNIDVFLLALKDIAEAQGGISALAKNSHISRQHLYKIFSGKISPKLDTFDAILHSLGYRISVESLKKVS